MAAVGRVLLSPLGAAVGLFKKPKAAGAAAAPVPTRNSAFEMARMRMGEMARRRGAGANELTGGGAEARTAGGKTLLGQ
jgi:hypothetical protein